MLSDRCPGVHRCRRAVRSVHRSCLWPWHPVRQLSQRRRVSAGSVPSHLPGGLLRRHRDCEPGDVCTGGASPTCCQPEHSSVTCFPTQGEPFCGFVNNNCGRPVDCGGCTLSNDVCAADNHCRSCGVDHQVINGGCCPNSSVCGTEQRFCCQSQNGSIAGQQRICCGGGQRCGASLGGGCRQPGTSNDCCAGTCIVSGSDEFGPFGTCQ